MLKKKGGWAAVCATLYTQCRGNVCGAHVDWCIVEIFQCAQARALDKPIRQSLDGVAYMKLNKRLDTVATPTPRGVRVFVMSVGEKGFYCLLVLGLTGLVCVFG